MNLAPSTDKILPFSVKAARFIRRPPEQDKRITALVGSVRSSKTWTMMGKALPKLCAYPVPGIRLLTGATKDSVYRNVLTDWFNVLGPSKYTYNRQSGELDIMGSKWVVMGAKDEGSERNVRGSTVGVWVGDEVVLYPESFTKMALNRMSPSGARAYWTTNPDSPYHHLKKILDLLESNGDIEIIHFSLDDNPNLADDYKQFIRRSYTGMYYQRFILGKWVAAEGAIYGSCWDENELTYAGDLPLGYGVAEETVGVDCGVTHPQVYHAVFDDGDTLYFDREYVWESEETKQQKTDGQYADDLEQFVKGEGLVTPMGHVISYPGRPCERALVLVPPECASFEAELTLRGIWHTDADNEVADGIKTVASLMALRKIKFSRERCPKTIARLPGYSWDAQKALRGIEEPIKKADDEADSVRYVCKSRVAAWRIAGRASEKAA
jgi:PBSX family phage terminase large subunit